MVRSSASVHHDAGTRQHGSRNIPLVSFLKGCLGKQRPEVAGAQAKAKDGSNRGGANRARAVEVEAPVASCVGDDKTLQAAIRESAIGKPAIREPVDFGYPRGLEARFSIGRELARGGNGIIRLVTDARTHQEYAMKCIPKMLVDPSASEKKREDHADALRREVDVMRRMRGVLNVASLEAVYEDEETVYIVMEYCTGGELMHVIGDAHYTEQTVASFMRATLRTLAQCHTNGIVHRDIKPGNFLLASDKADAPLKAIDFGLAAFVEGDGPATDLSLEGTPWYMAPETLSSQVYKASDIWAAGVMAYQLLTGKFPFNDKRNPYEPAISQVWKSILVDPLNMSEARWKGISPEAKDFVVMLLDKDPAKRPTAQQALKHPWLSGTIKDRHKGTPLSLAVVQRIQRFSQASVFKRSVLELIAEELMAEDVDDETEARACSLGEGSRAVITHPDASALEYLYDKLKLMDRTVIDRRELAGGLAELGYRLSESEVGQLLDTLDSNHTGTIGKSQLSASQIDWKVLERNNTRRWVERARRVFSTLDVDGDGVLSAAEITSVLASKLPPAEVEGALRHAMMEASRRKKKADDRHGNGAQTGVGDTGEHGGRGDAAKDGAVVDEKTDAGREDLQPEVSLHDGLRFHQFLRILSSRSIDSLDQYEDRLGTSFRTVDSRSSLNDVSVHDIDRLIERSLSVHGPRTTGVGAEELLKS